MNNTIANVGKRCTGCALCNAVCPRGCIEMKADSEGFLRPVIDIKSCVSCGLCASKCPAINPPEGHAPIAVYAAASKDESALMASSSGALFTALAKDTLRHGGRVYGVSMQGNEARWGYADDEQALAALRGSKYVQADMRGAFADVKKTLDSGRKVFFAACPCQVSALNSFLGARRSENLLTADVICHGVPSPLLFSTYLKWLENRVGSPVSAYRFRTKEKGWGMRLSCKTGKGEYSAKSQFDPYNSAFLKKETYRESCYCCPFARKERQGDLTLGDYWGILKEHPDFYCAQGVSLLLVNTARGEAAFKTIAPDIRLIESSFDRAAKHNQNLLHPSERPSRRDTVYQGIDTMPVNAFVSARLKVHNSVKETVKALIPPEMKTLLSRMLRGKSK